MPREDADTFDGQLNDGESTTLTVRAGHADYVVLTVDDGTQDGVPAAYDLTQRKKSGGDVDRYQYYDDLAACQRRSVVDPAVGTAFQVEIENVSGGTATYSAELTSRSEGN
jgi:hypothetical protein